MKYDIRQAAQALISQLKAIDYERLPISKYKQTLYCPAETGFILLHENLCGLSP